MDSATQFIFQILILIFSVVVHEVSHGYAALALGDKTAQDAGRLTLNPIKHLDPFGSIILPAMSYFLGGFIFGWAKPVPYNPSNLRNPFGGFGKLTASRFWAGKNWGPAVVALAGPFANISLAIVFGLIVRFLPAAGSRELVAALGGQFFFNFLAVASAISLTNLILAFFNLVPIPPLDGSKLLFAVLPYRWRSIETFLEQYGFFILLLFIFYFFRLLSPLVLISFRIITGTLPIF